jgi:hypothetical protein
MEPVEFAKRLLAQGIELVVQRGKRLHVWPPKAYPYLTDADREYIREHRAELKALVAARVLPEATVVWEPPASFVTKQAGEQPDLVGAPLLSSPDPPCPYCLQSPCVGEEHRHYWVLHWNDPREIERRAIKAAIIYRDTLRARIHFGIY